MTPQREKYLAKCSERELWIRRMTKVTKYDLKLSKRRLCVCEIEARAWYQNRIREIKFFLTAYRHELARLKGMDRVVVPLRYFYTDAEYGESVEYEIWSCHKCSVIGGTELTEKHNYCPNCGRRILWEKVK